MTRSYSSHVQPMVMIDALIVEAVRKEVVVSSAPGPSLTPAAARETAARLIAAAEIAERYK